MKFRAKAALMAAAVVIGASAAVAASSPAYAAFLYVITQHQGADHAIFNPADHVAQVCDSEADGHGVYGEFYTPNGVMTTISDTNGSAAGCGSSTLTASVYRFRVCERSASCSDYVQWTDTKVAELMDNSWAAYNLGGGLEVCDNDDDFVTISGTFVNAAGTTTTVTDTNGSTPGCGTKSFLSVVQFRLCWKAANSTTGCEDWVNLS
jgi:hypothetical protein